MTSLEVGHFEKIKKNTRVFTDWKGSQDCLPSAHYSSFIKWQLNLKSRIPKDLGKKKKKKDSEMG